MKRLLALLTVSCAAGLPLTAAAFDYGSDPRFVAAETGTPALPGARGENNPFADAASRHARVADDDAPVAADSETDKHPAPRAPTARRNAAPGAGAPGPASSSPQRAQSVLSWQSLLPGSIQ